MKRNSLRMRARMSPRTSFRRMRGSWKLSFIQVGGQPVYLVRSSCRKAELTMMVWFSQSKAKWEVRKMNISSHTCNARVNHSVTQRGKQLCGCLVPFARQFQGLKREFRKQNLSWPKYFPYPYLLMLHYSWVLNAVSQMPSYTVCLSLIWKWDPSPQNRLLPPGQRPLLRVAHHPCQFLWGDNRIYAHAGRRAKLLKF